MKRVLRGATLLELLIASGVFFTCLVCIFGIFRLGNEYWKTTNLRHALQSQARAALIHLEKDLRFTNKLSITIVDAGRTVNVPGLGNTNRHGICMATLADWRDPNNFDPLTQKPRWNRYTCYYATMEAGGARFVRSVIDPPGGAFGPVTMPGFSAANQMRDTPNTNLNQERFSVLADACVDFTVARNANGSIGVTFKARRVERVTQGDGALWQGQKRQIQDESFQLELEVVPENSYNAF